VTKSSLEKLTEMSQQKKPQDPGNVQNLASSVKCSILHWAAVAYTTDQTLVCRKAFCLISCAVFRNRLLIWRKMS